MIKKLLFVPTLLAGSLAFAGPMAPLSVQVVPAGGPLPGSILPPGNWVNDLDEHFSGASINTNVWQVLTNGQPGGGGVSNCQVPGALVINNGAILSPLPATSNGQSNGCLIRTPQIYSSPGYFEAYLQTDTGSDVWNGLFFEFGPQSDCGGDIAQNGVEPDLVEAFSAGVARLGYEWSGYSNACVPSTLNEQNVQISHNLPSADAYHVWGLDYGDNGSITWYRDGMNVGVAAPSDGVGTWPGQFIFMDLGWSGRTASNPSGLHIAWVRHYHH